MSLLDVYIPPGVVMAFTGTTAPPGYLFCDGSAVSRTTYAALFTNIGVTHGSGDGSTTFNLPDYRGRFHRGQDRSQGRDPDAGSRTAMAPGGNTADNVGSIQGHAFQTHFHSDVGHAHGFPSTAAQSQVGTSPGFTALDPTLGSGNTTIGATSPAQAQSATGTWAQATGNETRPVNANVDYIVKT